MQAEVVKRAFCPVCQATGGEVYATTTHRVAVDGRVAWIECPDCRLVYQQIFHRLPELTALNVRTPEPYETDAKIDDYEVRMKEKRPGYENRRNLLTKHRPQGELLVELGFGGGIMLKLLSESGMWQRVAGIEITHRYVEHARQRGFEAHWADVATAPPKILFGRADLVIGNELMEHVENPISFLLGAQQLMAGGGSMAFSFAGPDNRKNLCASEWQYWRVSSIERLFEQIGYRPEEFEIHPERCTSFAWVRPEIASA